MSTEVSYTSEQLVAAAIAAYSGVMGTATGQNGAVREISVDLALDALLYAAAIITEGTTIEPMRTPKDVREMTELAAGRFKGFLNEMKAVREIKGQSMMAMMGGSTDPAAFIAGLTKQ